VPNVYPGDPWERIRQLERDVEELKALLKARDPLTSASQGWLLNSMASPVVPASGDVHIYAQTGRLWARSTLGDVSLLPQGKASYVAPVTAVSAGATYTSTEQTLMNTLKTSVNDILLNLKTAGLMNTS
jgi:hypothetical protein